MKITIIDTNSTFANKLIGKIKEKNSSILPQIFNKFGKVEFYEKLTSKEYDDNDIFLINLESLINNKDSLNDINVYLNQQSLDLIYWIRSALQLKSPIIFYSFLSFDKIIQSNLDESYVLCSPGNKYIQLPFEISSITSLIENKKPLRSLQDVKPYLLPKVNKLLSVEKHAMANKCAMSLMYEVTKVVYGFQDEGDKYAKSQLQSIVNYRKSLEYFILKQYYGWKDITRPTNIGNYKFDAKSKKILLIDDKADDGWGKIISKMIYGDSNSRNIKFDKIEYENFKINLDSYIQEFKPHLVLLDLRLKDESGKKNVEELIGYKILKYLQLAFKGLPVIMFTATTNAETIKTLLNSGAKAVWTKPGLDEELDNEKVLARYQQLVNLVKNEFNVSVDFYSEQFEVLRKRIRYLLDYYKYRIELTSTEDVFIEFTDIFIDTNVFASTRNEFVSVLIKLYFLILTTKQFEYEYIIDGKQTKIKRTKIYVPNAVLFEIFKLSMRIDKKSHYSESLWKRQLIVYEVIRPFIENEPEKDKIKTEINDLNNSNEPLSFIKHPSEFQRHGIKFNYHADDVLVDEIDQIINNNLYERHIPVFEGSKSRPVYKNRKITIQDSTINRNVLLITNDSGLSERVKLLKKSTRNNLEIWDVATFNNYKKLANIISGI